MLALMLVLVAGAAPPNSDCATCHAAQAAEWKASLHAASTTDPLYRAMRAWARDDAGEAIAARCAICHSVERTTGGRADEVGCEACHQGFQDAPGPGGWRIDPSLAVRVARPVDAPHPTEVAPRLVESCLACHAEMRSPAGAPLCTTGPEAEARGGGPGCVDCHMRDGHAFSGTTPRMLARAAALSLDQTGGELIAAVVNRGAGHALPTGSALRQMRLEVEMLDVNGHPIALPGTSAEAVFARVLADAEGRSPVPPWRAAQVARDTRLAPGERHVLRVPIPAGAVEARARLVYRRAPAPVLARLGLEQWEGAAPIEMARARLPLRPADQEEKALSVMR